jgi:hypothetical protein
VSNKFEGRYGDCVGELFHECCELKVKDSLLDQFEEGEYHGTVGSAESSCIHIAFGKAVTEMRATLHDMQLDSASDAPVETELAEPDPLLESPSLASQTPVWSAPLPAPSTESKTEGSTRLGDQMRERIERIKRNPGQPTQAIAQASSVEDVGQVDTPDLPEVLREYWDQIRGLQPVKLDPTVDRSMLREQTKAIGQLGSYKFVFQDQTWHPK